MIELPSIEEQELSKLAGFAVNPQAQRLGYTDKKQYKIERDASLAVIKGKSDILWLSERYAKSYSASRIPTLDQYKDYLISLLLLEFVRDLQYYVGSSKLTSHAVKVWSAYEYKSIWPYIAKNTDVPNLYGWGPLGSLSFYTYYSPNRLTYSESSWMTQVLDCLKLFWLSVGQPFDIREDSTVINKRLVSLLKTVGITEEFTLLVEELFKLTYEKTLLARRRKGQTSAHLDKVKQRVIYNEYPQDIYQDALLQAPDKLKEDFTKVNSRLLAIAKPAGVRLVLQAVVIESLCRSVLLISELDELWKDQRLVEYNRLDAYNSFGADLVRKQLLENWIILSDAQHLQYLFNDPVVVYKQPKDILFWAASVRELDTSLTAPYRLTAFL
jgi:hypothetical protein